MVYVNHSVFSASSTEDARASCPNSRVRCRYLRQGENLFTTHEVAEVCVTIILPMSESAGLHSFISTTYFYS